MPGQQLRRKLCAVFSNANRAEFRDKNVLLVDDSIVRGTKYQSRSSRWPGSRREEGLSGVRRAGNSFPQRLWY